MKKLKNIILCTSCIFTAFQSSSEEEKKIRESKQKQSKMPIENLAEEGLEKNPDLELAQWKFMLGTDKYKSDPQLKNKMMTAITKDSKFSVHLYTDNK